MFKAVSRIWQALVAQFGKLARMIWKADPVAMYQAEVDRAADEIQESEESLAQYRGMVERINRQVKANQEKKTKYESRVKHYLGESNDAKAADYAVRLNAVTKELQENQGQLDEYQNGYDAHLKKIKAAKKRIQDANQHAAKLKANLDMSKAEARVAKLAQDLNVNVGSGNGTLNSMSSIEQEIQSQIDDNRGKAQVAVDLAADGLADLEEEERLEREEAKSILDQFKSEMNK